MTMMINFLIEHQFDKFSKTVGNAAVAQQQKLRDSFRQASDAYSVDAFRTHQTWPYYVTNYTESLFGLARTSSRIELVACFHVVAKEDRKNWANFATDNYQSWIKPAHIAKYGNLSRLNDNEDEYVPDMSKKGPDGVFIPDDEYPEYWPMWHYSPPPATYGATNFNLINVPDYLNMVNAMKVLKGESVINSVRKSVSTGTAYTHEEHEAMHSSIKTGSSPNHPHTFMWTPVYEDVNDVNSKLVGIIVAGFAWDFSLRNLLPSTVQGIIAVISNTCNQTYTYDIRGKDAYFIGEGDRHDHRFDKQGRDRNLSLVTHKLKDVTKGHCQYKMSIYPSQMFEESYYTNTPEMFAVIVALTFGMVAVVFFIYDAFVNKRNDKLIHNAARSNAIVTSLFPGKMRDRVLEDTNLRFGTKHKMKNFLNDGKENEGESKPLADLFLETTILFADITGFTSWSSVREPSQVFTLLENVYGAFDEIAVNRRIFKVETVGDCYVAASGIPDPRSDHAVAMIRFANDCVSCMHSLAKRLEVSLG